MSGKSFYQRSADELVKLHFAKSLLLRLGAIGFMAVFRSLCPSLHYRLFDIPTPVSDFAKYHRWTQIAYEAADVALRVAGCRVLGKYFKLKPGTYPGSMLHWMMYDYMVGKQSLIPEKWRRYLSFIPLTNQELVEGYLASADNPVTQTIVEALEQTGCTMLAEGFKVLDGRSNLRLPTFVVFSAIELCKSFANSYGCIVGFKLIPARWRKSVPALVLANLASIVLSELVLAMSGSVLSQLAIKPILMCQGLPTNLAEDFNNIALQDKYLPPAQYHEFEVLDAVSLEELGGFFVSWIQVPEVTQNIRVQCAEKYVRLIQFKDLCEQGKVKRTFERRFAGVKQPISAAALTNDELARCVACRSEFSTGEVVLCFESTQRCQHNFCLKCVETYPVEWCPACKGLIVEIDQTKVAELGEPHQQRCEAYAKHFSSTHYLPWYLDQAPWSEVAAWAMKHKKLPRAAANLLYANSVLDGVDTTPSSQVTGWAKWAEMAIATCSMILFEFYPSAGGFVMRVNIL